MFLVTVLFILHTTSIGIVESLTQIPKSAFGQHRRIPQVPAIPPEQTAMAPEQSAGFDSSQYKPLIQKQLENHIKLLQNLILSSNEPASAAPGAARVGRRMDQAFIESRGPNDFLVIMHKMKDPFESYIPNDIYYAAKPCVNWFDGCNEKGMMPPSLTRLNYLPF